MLTAQAPEDAKRVFVWDAQAMMAMAKARYKTT